MLLLRWHRFTRDNRAAILNKRYLRSGARVSDASSALPPSNVRQITGRVKSRHAVMAGHFLSAVLPPINSHPSPANDTRQNPPAFHHHFLSRPLWVRNDVFHRLLTPQRVACHVQRQEGDIPCIPAFVMRPAVSSCWPKRARHDSYCRDKSFPPLARDSRSREEQLSGSIHGGSP